LAALEEDARAIDRMYAGMIMICLSQEWEQDARDWDKVRFAALAALRREIARLIAQL
jgi:hypothetical protein